GFPHIVKDALSSLEGYQMTRSPPTPLPRAIAWSRTFTAVPCGLFLKPGYDARHLAFKSGGNEDVEKPCNGRAPVAEVRGHAGRICEQTSASQPLSSIARRGSPACRLLHGIARHLCRGCAGPRLRNQVQESTPTPSSAHRFRLRQL